MMRRKNKFLCIAMAAVLIAMLMMPCSAASNVTTVYVHGTELNCSPRAYRIGNSTYVPLRAFSLALDPEAELTWDKETKTAEVHFENLDLSLKEGETYLVANGRYIYLYGKVINLRGTLMLPIRSLEKALGITVDWDPITETVSVTGEVQPLQSGDRYYDADSLYWLSRIVYAEAGIESLEGKIAVANVVLNRMNNDYWPDTVYGVVFDNRGGVYQFSPVYAGTIYQEPSSEAVIAAKLALDGANVAGDSYFFLNPSISTNHWIENSCEFVVTIGRHSFYTSDI